MRAKRSTRRRDVRPGESGADAPGLADWIVANETGWGFPHAAVAVLAGVVIGSRAVGWQIGRIAAAFAGMLRGRRSRP
jgi:hypothetical protein